MVMSFLTPQVFLPMTIRAWAVESIILTNPFLQNFLVINGLFMTFEQYLDAIHWMILLQVCEFDVPNFTLYYSFTQYNVHHY